MSKSILLIHPDVVIQRDISTLFADSDHRLAITPDLRLMDFVKPDAALIGWQSLIPASESLRWLKQNPVVPNLRVLVLAREKEYPDAVRSLVQGADDCVTVPIHGDELLVRLNACFARPQVMPANDCLMAGPIVLDRRLHRVSVRDQNLELAPTEFRLLAFLLEHQGRVFSRNELLTRAWSRNVRAGHRTVDVHVRRLRQQLEPFRCADMIQTVRGFGYRLRADRSSPEA